MSNEAISLTTEQLDAFGAELDAIRQSVLEDRGERDANYIRRVIKVQRALEVSGRGLLWAGWFPPAWIAGTAALSVSKILDNMEIGHNVMHGQYDWMREPALNSKRFEWDTACPADQWRHSHNYLHHTYTNILDKDRDIGYGVLRMDETQPWRPYYLGNPVWAFLLMVLFEYGVAVHDLEVGSKVDGTHAIADDKTLLRAVGRKVGKQIGKDYLLFPLLSGRRFRATAAANAVANLVRNVWAFSIIFCGHFPSGVATFTEEEVENETRGQWYIRQMLGSANVDGSAAFHVLSGNLGHQIEHHIFPDLPARRYRQIAPEVRAICAKYGLPYNTGRYSRQLGSTWAKIVRLALPTGRARTHEPAVVVLRSTVAVSA
jgi:NADPH-dependent stearoyl-CoA 9-desaturase